MIAGVDQGGDGESAACGLAREGDVRRDDAVLQEGLIGRKCIVNRCRIRVLGGEPVVEEMTLACVRRPTCEASSAARNASPITYTPPWK